MSDTQSVRRIYLDQMWWVNLSKAEAGRKDSLHVSPLLEIANAQASEGRAIFPLSSTHFIEIAKIGNPD